MKSFLNHEITDKTWTQLIELKNVILVLLILLDFLFIIIITFFKVPYDDLYFMSIFDFLICVLLFVELIYEYEHYTHGLKSFLKEHYLDIIAIIPFNFIFLRYLAVYRIARLLQFLQIFKFIHLNEDTYSSIRFFIENGFLKLMILIVLLYVMFSSVVLVQIDPAFSSGFDAFWFNLVTITSVGYGDLTPLSNQGKLIAMFSIIIGIMFVSVFTAAMSGVYMQKPERETRKHFKNEIQTHIGRLQEENKLLHEEISVLKSENRMVNEKLDKVIELLDNGGDD